MDLKLQLKGVQKSLPREALLVCLVDEDRMFFNTESELLEEAAGHFQKEIKKKRATEPLIVFIPGKKGRGCFYLSSTKIIKYYNRDDSIRMIASAALLKAENMGYSRVAFLVNVEEGSEMIPLLCEGALLGNYRFDRYISKKENKKKPVDTLVFYCRPSDKNKIRKDIGKEEKVSYAVNRARDMVNETGGEMTPEKMAETVRELGKNTPGLSVKVKDEKSLKKEGYNGLLTVGAGSANPPRLITISYKPQGVKDTPHLCIIGKGVTFDTGGLCLKPPKFMMGMKTDMAGAAAVIYAILAMAVLKIPVKVTAIIPAAENSAGSKSVYPGDVFIAKNGKSIQVENTDAEGRLILTDGLGMAETLSPTHVVDVATLTGSCVMALGSSISGLFGDDEEFTENFKDLAEKVGEPCWRLPLHEEYKQYLKCDMADINNIGNQREAGAITAALFLAAFKPDDIPWIHLDIAGTSVADKPWKYFRAGATGIGVRTLVALAEKLSEK